MEQTIEAILRDTRFYDLLLGFDRQIAEAAHANRCPKCGAALHWGSWKRKPRGGPVGLEPRHRLRFSLCCAADGCRKRETPGSLRFLGRKVYFGAMVVLISTMQSGLNPERMKRLKALVSVSRRTVLRWRDCWHTVFAMSPFWRAHRGLAPSVSTTDLPASLLKAFAGARLQQLISLLRLLVPKLPREKFVDFERGAVDERNGAVVRIAVQHPSILQARDVRHPSVGSLVRASS